MKKSDQMKAQLLEQLKKTPIVQIACEKLGIGRASFYRWKLEDPSFAKAVEEATLAGQLLINDLAESQLIRSIKDRNMQAIMYWLRHHHEAYRNRLELETKVSTIYELSQEQKALVEQALKLANLTLDTYGSQSKSAIENKTESRPDAGGDSQRPGSP